MAFTDLHSNGKRLPIKMLTEYIPRIDFSIKEEKKAEKWDKRI